MNIPTDKISCIYAIINILDNKVYIGSAVNVRRRAQRHVNTLNNNKHHNIKLQNAWNKYGAENFKIEILKIIDNKDKLLEMEQFYIDCIKPIYNIALDAVCPTLGTKLSKEHKQKISDSNKGKKAYWYGKKLSEESKELNRQAHLGKKHTDATKKLMSAKRIGKYIGKDSPCWGKTATDETRQKMSESHKKFYENEEKRKEHSKRMKIWWANKKKNK